MEFNAVIFCGQGHNLIPLTSPGESRISKALLPVANKPLIEYVLKWCDQAPFKTINIVTQAKDEKQISEVVFQYDKSRDAELRNSSPIKVITSELTSTGAILNEIFPLSDIDNESTSSESNESKLKDSDKENFVILPCDFITDVPPQVFIEVYRGNSDENIGLSLFYNNNFEGIDKKVLKSNYTVYSNQENGNMVLLDMYSKDFVTIDKFLKIRTQLLWRYPSTLVSTKLLDSFIFFMNWKCRRNNNITDNQLNRPINKIKRDLSRNSWKHSNTKSTIGLFALPEGSLFVRCNNLPVYMEMNRYFLKDVAKFNSNKHINANKENKNSATIGSDCLVGNNTELGERTNVKRSVIGNNVKIGKKCRISGCILLDDVSIEDDVQLENCIIGKNVKMESKCRLINCNVEGSYTVGKNVNLKGETLKNISLDELSDGVLYSEDESEDEEDSEDEDDLSDGESFDDEGFEEEEYEDDIFSRG